MAGLSLRGEESVKPPSPPGPPRPRVDSGSTTTCSTRTSPRASATRTCVRSPKKRTSTWDASSAITRMAATPNWWRRIPGGPEDRRERDADVPHQRPGAGWAAARRGLREGHRGGRAGRPRVVEVSLLALSSGAASPCWPAQRLLLPAFFAYAFSRASSRREDDHLLPRALVTLVPLGMGIPPPARCLRGQEDPHCRRAWS